MNSHKLKWSSKMVIKISIKRMCISFAWVSDTAPYYTAFAYTFNGMRNEYSFYMWLQKAFFPFTKLVYDEETEEKSMKMELSNLNCVVCMCNKNKNNKMCLHFILFLRFWLQDLWKKKNPNLFSKLCLFFHKNIF